MNIAKTLYAGRQCDVTYTPDVVFAHRETGDLTLQLVSQVPPALPRKVAETPVTAKFARWGRALVPQPADPGRFPLIVDCPGSGWAGADGHAHVPYLVDLARSGFVAASISYRGTYRDNVVFPASVQDLLEAVRFLRANAAVFHIDPDRVALMGDSSGGNTAAMAAVCEDPEFILGDHRDQSTAVKACCCVYAPVDMVNLVQDRIDERKTLRPDEAPFPEGVPFEAMEIWQEQYLSDPEGYMRRASPLHRIERTPPFLFIQGDDDRIIPMAQGLRFCDALREKGGRAEFVKVAGGEHGASVWTRETLDCIVQFFRAYV